MISLIPRDRALRIAASMERRARIVRNRETVEWLLETAARLRGES